MRRVSDILTGVLLGLALSFVLPSEARANPSLDGYSFERKEFEHRDIRVVFVPMKKQTDLRAFAEVNGIHLHEAQIKAFSIPYGNVCVIYAIDPAIAYEPEFLGHELAHCIYGNFHPMKDKDIK